MGDPTPGAPSPHAPGAAPVVVTSLSAALSGSDRDQSQASDVDPLFANGYEDPQVNAPAGSVRIPAIALARSLADEAVIVLRLTDANGEAVRVYARIHEQAIQYALARRASNGKLRPGAWVALPGEPTLSWTARETALGWMVESLELR